MNEQDFFTSSEAAHLLGISMSSFYRLEKSGEIKPSVATSYKKLYKKSDIVSYARKYIEEQELRHKEVAKKRAQGSYLYQVSVVKTPHTTQHTETNKNNALNDNLNKLILTTFSYIKNFKRNIQRTKPSVSSIPYLIKATRARISTLIRLKHSMLPFAIGILLILIPITYLVTKHSQEVAAWYDDNWNYRVKYTINNTGSADANKKVKADIDTQALVTDEKIQVDCDDSRFTDINGKILEYFIDAAGGACNTASTDYYILISTINAGDTIIYHYYGNPSATAGTKSAQFSQATFTPNTLTAASAETGRGPIAYWKLDESYTGGADAKIEQQLEILNKVYHTSYASWYDGSWTKRKIIEIENTTSTSPTDQQVTFDVAFDADMQADFDDLRFTNSAGTLLDYWIESKTDSSTAKVWLELPSLPANDKVDVYMYYGNSGASIGSNGSNTFAFFDTFDTLDAGVWGDTGAESVSNSELIVTTGSVYTSSSIASQPGYVTEANMRWYNRVSGQYAGLVIANATATTANNTTSKKLINIVGYQDQSKATVDIANGSTASYNVASSVIVYPANSGDYHILGSIITDSQYKIQRDRNTIHNVNGTWSDPYYIFLGRYLGSGSSTTNTMDVAVDWVIVRKYISEDPIIIFNSEHTSASGPVYTPEDNSLGLVRFDPDSYKGNKPIYLDAVVSTNGTTWSRVRSNEISSPSILKDFSVRIRSGNNSGTSPSVQLYNATDDTSDGTISFGEASNTQVYVKSARLVILQSSPSGLYATKSGLDIGSSEKTTSESYSPQTDKKIYNYNSASFDPSPTTNFEADLKVTSPDPTLEQQINIVNGFYSVSSTTYAPDDNSLGIITWDGTKYPNSTVYFEATIGGGAGGNTYAALHETDGTVVTDSEVNNDYSAYNVVRSGAITLETGTSYTVRVNNTSASYDALLKNARLVVIQTHTEKITTTQTSIDIGDKGGNSSGTYAAIPASKEYYYDSTKFTPAPTAEFEAVMRSNYPKIEQQINILNQHYLRTSTSYGPGDLSVGLITWDGTKYPNSTVYFEATMRSGNAASTASVALFAVTDLVNPVTGSVLTQNKTGTYTLERSGAITLSNGTTYTIQIKSSNATQYAQVGNARLIIIQENATKLTDTETQIEVGDNAGSSSTSYTELAEKKIYYYDSTKYSPAPTTYFEASFRPAYPKIEQQINILNKKYISNSASYTPSDNAVGMFKWDGTKYSAETVYFEAQISAYYSGATAYAALYDVTDPSNPVSGSEVSVAGTTYTNVRSSALTLSNGATYTIRIKTSDTAYEARILTGRLIVVQSDSTKITDTETQVEIGTIEGSSATDYTQLTHNKRYLYDSSTFTPTPTAYLEAAFRPAYPKIEQQISIISQTTTTTSTSYTPTDSSLGAFKWEASKYSGDTVYFEAVIRNTSGSYTATAALFDVSETVNPVTDSAVSITNTTYVPVRSSALTLVDGTTYTVRLKSSTTNGTTTLSSAKLIIVQSDATKITDTQTQVEIGASTSTTSASYVNLTDKKIYYYDSSKFTPAPTIYFEATLAHGTAGETAYAALYTDGASCSSVVSGSEVTVVGTTYTLSRSGSISLSSGTAYTVCIKSSSGTANIKNAKIILEQTDSNGITALETLQSIIPSLKTATSTSYTGYNPTHYHKFTINNFGTYPKVYLEVTAKATSGNTLMEIISQSTNNFSSLPFSEVTATGTSYVRSRTSSDFAVFTPNTDTPKIGYRLRNSLTSQTGSFASAWLVVQISNLPTAGTTGGLKLYNIDGTAVTNSEVSSSTEGFTVVRSSSFTITSGQEYEVRAKQAVIMHARLVLTQSDGNGITELETVRDMATAPNYDTGTTYVSHSRDNRWDPESFGVQPTVYFEGTMKAAANTARMQLDRWTAYNVSTLYSTITTTSTSYTRVRDSTAIEMPTNSNTYTFDTSHSNSTSSIGVYTINSRLIVQLDNIPTAGITGSVALYNGGTQVTSSELTSASSGFTVIRSSAITLTTETEYIVKLKQAILISAKVVHTQSNAGGITDLEVVRYIQSNNGSGSSSGATAFTAYNEFDLDNMGVYPSGAYFESVIKASGYNAISILYAETINTQSNVLEISTSSTSYVRVRSSEIMGDATLPFRTMILNTGVRNSQSGASNYAYAAGSALVLQYSNIPTAGAPGASAQLYHSTDTVVTDSEVTIPGADYALVRSGSITLTTDKEYYIKVNNGFLLNARILINQSDGTNGINALETVQHMINSQINQSLISFNSKDYLIESNPSNYTNNVSMYFEAILKKVTGTTASARLYNNYTTSAITGSQVDTTSSSYDRVRSSDIASNMSWPKIAEYNVQIQNTGGSLFISNAWVITQITNLGKPIAYAALYENGTTCDTQVSGSEITVSTSPGVDDWTRTATSSPITLTNGTDYMVCTKATRNATVHLSNAKITHAQTDTDPIVSTETYQVYNNTVETDADNTYTSKGYPNEFDPDNFSGDVDIYMESTLKTSSGTGYVQLYNDTATAAVASSEKTTTSSTYTRLRTNALTNPTEASNLDVQLKNAATDTTSSSSTWVIIRYTPVTMAIAHDSTANAYNGTVKGAQWKLAPDCISGNCLQFDGLDDLIVVNDARKLDFGAGESFTINLWFKQLQNNTTAATILTKYEATGADGGYKIYMGADDNVNFEIADSNTPFPDDSVASSTGDYEDNKWHSLAAVKNANTGIYLYIDGKLVDSDEDIIAEGSIANNDDLYMGINYDNGTYSEPWNGILDEIKIYPYARSETEIITDTIQKASNRGSSAVLGGNLQTLLNNGLLGYWKMDESAANSCTNGISDACDSAGNKIEGTWYGNAANSAGKFGNSVVLDGTDDRLRIQELPNQSDWFSQDTQDIWRKRQPVTVTNSSGGALTDYQVKLDITYDSNMQTDFDDLRFTSSNGITLLDHWTETYTTSTSAVAWVEVPSLPEGDTTVYMYYDNSTATSTSSMENTMRNDSIHLLIARCPSGDPNCSTNPTTHTRIDSVITSVNNGDAGFSIDGNGYRTTINDSTPPWGSADNYLSRYRFLFKADTTGSHSFGVNTDAAGEIFKPDIGDVDTSHTVLASWYSYSGSGTCGTSGSPGSYSLNAGEVIWLEMRHREEASSQLAQACIQEPAGSYQTISTTNFAGQLFSRTITLGTEPTPAFGTEQAVVAYTDLLNTITSEFTVSTWVYPTTLGATRRSIVTRGDSPTQDWFIQTSSSDAGKIEFSADGTNTATSTTTLSTDTWYHLTMTAGGGKTKLFINGALDTETDFSGTITTSGIVSFGNDPSGGTGWIGKIDEARLYNIALTDKQVNNLYDLEPGPVGYWDFNTGEGTSVYDVSGGPAHGLWQGTGTTWANGKFGKAGSFNGTDNYVDVDGIVYGGRTVSFWINPDSNTESILALNGSAYISASSGTISATGFSTPSVYVNGVASTTLTASVWQHVTVTTETAINATAITLGLADSAYFDGMLDEVKIYNYVRDATNIIEDMNAGHPVPGSPVGSAIIYWEFDDGYDTTARNSGTGGSTYNASLSNMASPATADSGWSNSGKYNKALAFDGSNDYVSSTSAFNPSTSDFTLSVWAYPEASSLETSEMRTLFAQQDGAGTGQSWLQIDDSPVQWRSYLGGSERSSGITASINTWQHVVLVYDDSANTLTWYVDGREGATHTSVGVESATGNFILGAAKATTAGRYDGRLDEVNIFNTALTSDQVVLLFNQSKSVSMGSTSTASDGTTADNSTAREYCIPGDTTSCAGPVAEYKLDENTGTSGAVIYDTSGNNNTGTMTSFSASPSPWKPGKHGSSLQFNGSQYVAIADSDSLDYGTGDFTITVWVKTTETCTDNKVYWGQRYSPTTIWTGCDATGNVAGFDADSSVSSFSAIRGTTAINDGKWHQITAVKTGHASAYVYLYVDGVLEASAGPRSYSGDFNFGAGAGINSIGRLNVNPYYYPVAQIDHVRVYNYARTAAQVAWEHNHGGPVGWWQFDECTGVNAYDSSGHDNHGTVTEPGAGTNVGVGICTGSAGTMRSDGSNGKRNAALDFDGADDYVVVTDATAIQNIFDRGGAVTVWIYPRSDGEGNLGRILDKTDSVTEGWVINVREESAGAVKLWLGQEYTGNDRDWVTTNAVIPLNQWSHIAVVYDNSSTSNDPVFYLNGKTVSLSEQGSGNLPAKSDAGNNLYIGNRSNGQRTFDGMLDEVKMFNYSLTAHQVLVDYNEGAVRFE